MNFTQNERIKQVTSDTLIVGGDVGSQTHFCRAFDWRGVEVFSRVCLLVMIEMTLYRLESF